MSKYEIDVWEYADEFKNLDTNETFYGYQVCELLEHKDQQISDLETKLAESNESHHKNIVELTKMVTEKDRKIEELKQQLHDLPKKIVEEITNELSNNTSLYFEMRESTSAHCPNKEYEWFNYVRFRNYINTILKKYGVENE